MTVAPPHLPPVWVLTDRHLCAPRPLPEAVADLVAGAPDDVVVVLREKDLSRDERVALAAELLPMVRAAGGALVVASDDGIAADGTHLAAADPQPDASPGLLGRSCHSVEDVRAAAAEGCDYVFVSPVFASQSKPGYGEPAPRTWEPGDDHPGLALLRDAASPGLPVVALGGIAPANAARCAEAGAASVATLGRAMTAASRGAGADLVAALLAGFRGAVPAGRSS